MRSHRPRRLVLVVAALLVSAPVLWGSAAQAQSTDRVTFTGGCDAGSAGAVTAEPGHASVPLGATLEFLNDLGEPAVLSLDGEAAVELPSGGMVGVVLHHGPVTAAMQVSCPTGDVSGSATIEVSGPADQPDPSDRPGSSGPRLGDAPDAVPSDLLTPRLDQRGEPSPGAGPEADGDNGDLADAQVSQASGSGWGAGSEGVLAVVAALCVVAVSAGAVRTLLVRRTVKTYRP